MSAGYVPVGWNRSKYVYDGALLAGVAAYLTLYFQLGPLIARTALPIDPKSLSIKAFGSCAFVMLSLILMIGPLSRLDRRFLPLLYNRRHFGVMTCAIAACHAYAVLGWYFGYSETPPLVGLLGADVGYPFIPFGIGAFLILLLLASTSHDFWLAFLGPPVWKALHQLLYLAYVLVAGHLAFGILQDAKNPFLPVVAFAMVTVVSALHLMAAFKTRREDARYASLVAAGWIDAGAPSSFEESRAVVVALADQEKVAIFRHEGRLSAMSNVCAHQNGPLGEGRVIDGCVTCPWHGFQYRLEDGCAPPPFTEKLATYGLRLVEGRVLLNPIANPPGTPVAPLALSGS